MRTRRHLGALTIAGLLAGGAVAAREGEPGLTELQGSAYLGRNRPVVGATVLVGFEEGTGPTFLTATDGKGQFRLDALPEGRYRVDVSRHGLAPVVKRDVELRRPFRAVIELPMQPATGGGAEAAPAEPTVGGELALSGRVVARDGAALRDVRLRFVPLGAAVDPRELLSGEDGSFATRGLPRGDWRIEVTGVGQLPIRAALRLIGDATLSVVLVAQPAGYTPTPIELMPPERPSPPPSLAGAVGL